MLLLSSLIAIQEPAIKVDLTAYSLAQTVQGIRTLSPGQGQYLHVDVFDGRTAWATAEGAKRVAASVKVLVTAAHERGYRVLGEWRCLQWKGIAQEAKARDILEHRATNAFARKGETDFVSPFSTEVRDRLNQYLDALAEEKVELDALLVTYRLPRSPVLACGLDSRMRYLALESLDPVDMIEGPTLRQSDRLNQPYFDYMAWRLKESNRFLSTLLGAIRTKLPDTPIALRADPQWSSRNPLEKGAGLGDWVAQAAAVSGVGVFLDGEPTDPKFGPQMQAFLAGLQTLPTKPAVWLDTAGREDQITPIVSRLSQLGYPVRAFLNRSANAGRATS